MVQKKISFSEEAAQEYRRISFAVSEMELPPLNYKDESIKSIIVNPESNKKIDISEPTEKKETPKSEKHPTAETQPKRSYTLRLLIIRLLSKSRCIQYQAGRINRDR